MQWVEGNVYVLHHLQVIMNNEVLVLVTIRLYTNQSVNIISVMIDIAV